MPSMVREFHIPGSEDGREPERAGLTITLFEPSLTADNLGHKTWSASYLLSRRLGALSTLLPSPSDSVGGLRALELGSGTGLLGVAFGSLFPRTAIDLTDLPDIVPNLARNLAANRHLLERAGSSGFAYALDWAGAVPRADAERYHVVLAADPIYGPEHPSLLVGAIRATLGRSNEARLVIGLPLRDAYVPEVEDLRGRLEATGLTIVQEGEEVGFDDWEARLGDRVEVRCWWTLWRWR